MSHGFNELSFVEAEFAERLLALGKNNDARGRACVLLSLTTTKESLQNPRTARVPAGLKSRDDGGHESDHAWP
jgi:hypothetical protein